jgi:hypothetical protein
MEPADLNSPPDASDDARLRALLRRQTAPLPDGGFSARVMAALPVASTPSRAYSPRIWIYLAGALAGSGFAFWRAGSWGEIRAETIQAVSRLGAPLATFNDPTFILALAVAAFSLLVAFRTEVRRMLFA